MRVPNFHENFDDVHCMESAIRSIIEYFEPEIELSWEEIDRLSNKIPGKWSWPQFAMKSMLDRGYEVKRVSPFNLQKIIDLGVEQYLIEMQGEEAAKISIEKSPPAKQIEDACRDLVVHSNWSQDCRIPAIEDIVDFLDKGYLVTSMVNARALNGKEGYAGHTVLIYAMDNEFVYMQDSGLPAYEERKVPIDQFVQAAKSPKDTNWYIVGYKKN